MPYLNTETKARCADPDRVRQVLESVNAVHAGMKRQVDTYFNVRNGRLKLREEDGRSSLVYYQRPDVSGPKGSTFTLYDLPPDDGLKEMLASALGVMVVVDKQRDLYLKDNVRFHLDVVNGLGIFIEIEANDTDGAVGGETLRKQCEHFLDLLRVHPDDLVPVSYSDLLLERKRSPQRLFPGS